MSPIQRACSAISTVALAIVCSSSPASAQGRTTADGCHNAHRLGGSTSFYKPPLTNAASVKRMAAARGIAADIRKVLADNGIPETSDAVLAILSGATSSVAGGRCTDATPAEGVLVECDFPTGATLEWMAYRPNLGKGNRGPWIHSAIPLGGTEFIPSVPVPSDEQQKDVYVRVAEDMRQPGADVGDGDSRDRSSSTATTAATTAGEDPPVLHRRAGRQGSPRAPGR